MRCHLACLIIEEPQVGLAHWCHLPRFGTRASVSQPIGGLGVAFIGTALTCDPVPM